jgi:hypothetical protein
MIVTGTISRLVRSIVRIADGSGDRRQFTDVTGQDEDGEHDNEKPGRQSHDRDSSRRRDSLSRKPVGRCRDTGADAVRTA